MSLTARPGADPPAPRKILLIRLRRAGDVIMTTPALAVLKKAFPGASLSYLVEEPFARLVEGNPAVDEVIRTGEKEGLGEFLRLVRRVRRKKFDVLVDFHGGPRASWLTLLSGARVKVGYRIKHKSFIYGLRVPRAPEKGHVHSVLNHVNLVKALGLESGEIPPLVLPRATPEEAERVRTFLKERGFDGLKIVVIHVGAGNRFRDWGQANWSALAARLAGVEGLRLVLAGGPEDAARAEAVAAAAGGKGAAAAGTLNYVELREVIARSVLFVGPDSGPMHVAASTSTPIVALFGPTLPEVFAPWRSGAKVLERDLDCRPCRQRKCLPGDFRCLQETTPDEVFRACLDILSNRT